MGLQQLGICVTKCAGSRLVQPTSLERRVSRTRCAISKRPERGMRSPEACTQQPCIEPRAHRAAHASSRTSIKSSSCMCVDPGELEPQPVLHAELRAAVAHVESSSRVRGSSSEFALSRGRGTARGSCRACRQLQRRIRTVAWLPRASRSRSHVHQLRSRSRSRSHLHQLRSRRDVNRDNGAEK